MTTEQRKEKILELLKKNDTVRVTNLSRLFGVSEVTIRTYLEDMEKKGTAVPDPRGRGQFVQALLQHEPESTP